MIQDINDFQKKVYSQNGEDGIIEGIFNQIGTTNKFSVEFGAGSECNTRYLLEHKGWKCLMMDCFTNKGWIKKEYITAENINSLFKKYSVPKHFDLLSIDIDGNDYWVWKSLEDYHPRVIVIEYNGSIPLDQSKTIKYDPNHVWDKRTNYFGASLLALFKLGKEKGYTLVGCDRDKGINAFFVKDGLIEGNFVKKEIQELFSPPQYGTIGYGYPKNDKEMINV